MVCGYAEILKHAVIKDLKFFQWLKLNSKFIFSRDKLKINFMLLKKVAK